MRTSSDNFEHTSLITIIYKKIKEKKKTHQEELLSFLVATPSSQLFLQIKFYDKDMLISVRPRVPSRCERVR